MMTYGTFYHVHSFDLINSGVVHHFGATRLKAVLIANFDSCRFEKASL